MPKGSQLEANRFSQSQRVMEDILGLVVEAKGPFPLESNDQAPWGKRGLAQCQPMHCGRCLAAGCIHETCVPDARNRSCTLQRQPQAH